jgi:ABC-type enterochelin transport system permease subunit
MPRLIKNNIKSPVETISFRRELNNKTMKRELVFPLIVGIILGGLVMIFWQFNARLNNQIVAMNQLQQATAQNTKNVTDIVTFINNATGADKTPAATTPAATTAE